MTFVLAWKRAGIAYICADSARTTFKPNASDDDRSTTSFGETLVNRDGLQVLDRNLKIHRIGNSVAAFAGEVAAGRRLLIGLSDSLVHFGDPAEALSVAVNDSLEPSHKHSIQAAVASPSGAEARIAIYNTDGDESVHEMENETIARFGSMPSNYRHISAAGITKVAEVLDAKRQLACILSLLQSFGINRNLMEVGVGGAYSGVYVTGDSINWQGDMRYVVIQPGNYWAHTVTTAVRDNVLIIRSAISRETLIVTLFARS